MENKINPSSSNKEKDITFFLPTIYQIVLYFLISCLVLIMLNTGKAWDYLNNTVLIPQGGLDSIIATNAPSLHTVLNYVSQSIILQVIFWVFVGSVVYVLIWFVKNIAINLLNDITADQYIHPKSYQRTKFWSSILARRIFFWVSAVIVVVYISVSMRFIFYLANICYEAIVKFHPVHSSLTILESALVITGVIYILVVVVHIVANSWRLLYKDL
jgi:hypothetical protein